MPVHMPVHIPFSRVEVQKYSEREGSASSGTVEHKMAIHVLSKAISLQIIF
jgi:hypothetical protein